MLNSKKYKRLPKIDIKNRQWPDTSIDKAPIWCSVDLRDGNQALALPMNIEEKLELFNTLVEIGFKEIEVGFPSASQTEFDFLRRLIEENRIPDDVTIQVLTQAREHLILKTFEALKGAKNAIIHIYNSTSALQRKITFSMSKQEIKDIAIAGVTLVKKLAPLLTENGTNLRLEYSPESFSDTEIDFAVEICESVMEVWQPSKDNKIILNLPETVQYSTPNIYADQIEYFCTHLKNRQFAIISLHTHNDRGTGTASSELGLMAGADRIEGTLFGNGERTGNQDIVALALNLYAQGVEPNLDFSDMPKIRQVYERCTKMIVPPRSPYAGDLVFTAFSGSHQDAIKKGMDKRRLLNDENAPWEVPYLMIDPMDIGMSYEAIIRINSQSGKGGVAYILADEFGYDLPKSMQPEVGNFINDKADGLGVELTTKQIFDFFQKEFVNVEKPLSLQKFNSQKIDEENTNIEASVVSDGVSYDLKGQGNGPINAFAQIIKKTLGIDFHLTNYLSHSMGAGSNTDSASYVELKNVETGKKHWGCGLDTSIETAGIKALVSAINRMK